MRLAALFTDHMVLQHGIPCPVWGWDTPGQTVEVRVAGVSARGRADTEGRWRVDLPPLAEGGPHTLSVRGSETQERTDVLVGEVWICSGQSNMQWALSQAADADAEVAAADCPRLRLFQVPCVAKPEGPTSSAGTSWGGRVRPWA